MDHARSSADSALPLSCYEYRLLVVLLVAKSDLWRLDDESNAELERLLAKMTKRGDDE